MNYKKKDIITLVENYISKRIDSDVDSFLFNNSTAFQINSMDVLNFINNSSPEDINHLYELVRSVMNITNPNELKVNPVTYKITSMIKGIE